jgi:hypothetical protein
VPLLFFGAILIVLLLLLVNWAARSDSATVHVAARYFIGFLVLAAVLFLVARGLTGVALALLVGAALWAFRARLAGRRGRSRLSQPPSQVDTRYLRVTLDPESGAMEGVVLAGRFAGQRLGEMTRDDLSALYDELRREDPEGAILLDAFLARAYPGEWQQEAQAKHAGDGPMTREEAFEILGLAPGATSTDIKEAHHRLMKKFHPDQGGTTYFAARINEAKDLLLKT